MQPPKVQELQVETCQGREMKKAGPLLAKAVQWLGNLRSTCLDFTIENTCVCGCIDLE